MLRGFLANQLVSVVSVKRKKKITYPTLNWIYGFLTNTEAFWKSKYRSTPIHSINQKAAAAILEKHLERDKMGYKVLNDMAFQIV